jgi:hypothetical protein
MQVLPDNERRSQTKGMGYKTPVGYQQNSTVYKQAAAGYTYS